MAKWAAKLGLRENFGKMQAAKKGGGRFEDVELEEHRAESIRVLGIDYGTGGAQTNRKTNGKRIRKAEMWAENEARLKRTNARAK